MARCFPELVLELSLVSSVDYFSFIVDLLHTQGCCNTRLVVREFWLRFRMNRSMSILLAEQAVTGAWLDLMSLSKIG